MKPGTIRLALLTLSLPALLFACRPSNFVPDSHSAAVTRTMLSAASLQAAIQSGPTTRTTTQPTVVTPAATLTPTPSPTAQLIHLLSPGDPPPYTSLLSDRSSAPHAHEKRTISDHFDHNIFERPLSAEEMEYQGHLDIAPIAELSLAPPWVYVTIHLVRVPPREAQAEYSVELDINVDGRGDWLITASAPRSNQWTHHGVRALLDSNGDVGGKTPMVADPQPQAGDGYDTLIFAEGTGSDPDVAWVRISPHQAAAVEIAFKHALIGGDETFTWSVWADGGVQQPEWFDYNDHFTVEQAGSPIISSDHYPLQQLELVDNTCRWVQGIVPRVGMPGLCFSQ